MFEMARFAAKHAKIIPEEYRKLIPLGGISISSLLDTLLPPAFSSMNVLSPAGSYVVCKPPNWTEQELRTMRVPSKEWLRALDSAIVDGWLKGVLSVEHPANGKVRFPLWVGTLWMELLEVIREQREWQRAREWVCTLPQGGETHKVQAMLDRVPWKENTWMVSEADRAVTKVSFFAGLLSDSFLAERHIDAFVTYLNIQARRRNPVSLKTFVADLSLSQTLLFLHNATRSKIQDCKILSQYTAMFKHKKGCDILLFPAHVGGDIDGHWVVFRIDYKKGEYGYGELCERANKRVYKPKDC